MIDTKDKKQKSGGEDRKSRHRAPRKFFFDMNNFDEEAEEEIEEEEPPPPVFSEDELTAAREVSYQKGKKDGLAEAEASREKQIAQLLAVISQNFQTLFDAEQDRAGRYEAEAVVLARAIFEKLFPAMNEKQGLEEIETVIKTVLDSQREENEIIIEVQPDYVDSIQDRLKTAIESLPVTCQVTVKGRDNLGPGDCGMSWRTGGAGRNATALAEEIHRQLEHILADKPALQDNDDKTENESQETAGENATNGEDQ